MRMFVERLLERSQTWSISNLKWSGMHVQWKPL